MSLSILWQCQQCGASGTLVLDDDDLDDSDVARERVSAAHDADPQAQRIACSAGDETAFQITAAH